MNRKGSITVFLSLLLTIMISLVSASIYSVKIAAGRMQLANAVDQGTFSLFARYDRDLLERYGIFFVDGGCGTSELKLGKCYERVTDSMSYLLDSNKGNIFGGKMLFSLKDAGGGIAGYTLATDLSGAPFAAQAIDYMKETAILQGIGMISDRIASDSETVKMQEALGKEKNNTDLQGSYENIQAEAARIRAEKESAEKERAEAGEENTFPEEEAYIPPANFKNPMDEIVKVSNMSVLQTVCVNADRISGKKVESSLLLSGRSTESGMGVIDVRTSIHEPENSLWFDEYILSHYGSYRKPSAEGALAYQVEYAVAGKKNDIANLESVVTRLLVMREGVNLFLINNTPELKAQAQATAGIITSILTVPQAAKALEAVIIAGWAYCESLIDVRGLLDGDRIPLVKTSADWQLALAEVPGFTSRIDTFRKRGKSGTSYEDYLRIFLFLTKGEDRISRTMDMTESTIRSAGRTNFRLDCCFDSLTVQMKARAEGKKEFITEKTLCYRDITGSAGAAFQ